MIKKIKTYFEYKKDLKNLIQQKGNDKAFPFGKFRPILNEKHAESGIASGHYFHQDLLIARKIFENKPTKHVDIGSRTDGFVAHVASYREIEVFDIREQENKIKNIIFKRADLTKLTPDLIGYCDSISSLHAIEHFGLGRYGDSIDYNGHLKALANIEQILQKGGRFYFSTPIGPQRIEFNAHRVFSVRYLLDLFEPKYYMDSFSFVDDAGNLHEDVSLSSNDIDNNFGCSYGCGIFELTKK
ncbi:MAG: class I SAM-dependent methyltransferase [Ferruginibacter sp.]|nr:class I SAM-dependent methyltransferase [Ferruginibacter sp.]